MKKSRPNRMLIPEYRRRVFNEAMLTCLEKIHGQILNGTTAPALDHYERDFNNKMAADMCRAFFKEELKLETSTVDQTKKRLSEAVTFIKDCAAISEAIADEKANAAAESGCEMDDDQKIELSDEDEEVIEQLFDTKSPEVQVDAIRDATVKALIAEDQKAQELKSAMDIANSQVAAGEDPSVMEETITRLNRVGPTSLMNAIINNITAAAIKDVNESGTGPISISGIMKENADTIKTRAVMVYSLYEAANMLGITKMTQAEIKHLAEKIYYNK